jgi:hypothetical protein
MGVWLSGRHIRIGLARSLSPWVSATVAMISAAAPKERQPGSATISRPVLATDSQTVVLSHGESVRRSITSTSTPSFDSLSAASSDAVTIEA